MADMELTFIDWRKWSLEQKVCYLKGSGGGYNLKRQDIAALDDDYREMRYPMKNHRMAIDVIEAQEAEIKRLREDVSMLWMLLDDIDTLDDAAKDDDFVFRKACYKIQQKRWKITDPFFMEQAALKYKGE